jgi:CheY-like chemotaxis protein
VKYLFDQIGTVKDHVEMTETDNAEEALKLFATQQFDYVIADIDLGKNRMNGYEFARVVLDMHPDTRVLIHSNKRKNEMDKNIRQIASANFMGFLPKPMKQSELLQFLACKTFEVPSSASKDAEKRKCILVVNDDDGVRIALRFQLKAAGDVQVVEASGVSDALAKLSQNSVDVVLSDINLGEGEPDGYELLKKVRSNDPNKPFYLISGYSHATESPKAKEHGANGYLQ